jgi:hypothetical protein
MTAYTEKLLSDDFVWDAITTSLHSRKRRASTGFIRFDCPMCIYRGTGADKRGRGGVKHDGAGIGVHCFNCGFRSKFVAGEVMTRSFREFLGAIGIPEEEVQRLNLRAFRNRMAVQRNPVIAESRPAAFVPDWKTSELPSGARLLTEWAAEGCEDPNFLDVVTYLYETRGHEIADAYSYAWTPEGENHGMNRRVIIPFLYNGRVVGYTARAIDPDAKQRYHMEAPANFMFNTAALAKPNRRFAIFTEGGFDAIALDGIGLLGAKINAQQIAWIKSFDITPIILPDRDKRGLDLIDMAVANGFHVSFPSLRDGSANQRCWEADVKDAAEATKRYGRLWTLHSVLQSATANKLEINIKRKWLY